MAVPFLRQDTFGLRTQETFIGNSCEIYIPTYFIDQDDNRAIAKELGDRIETIGLFWFKVDGQYYELQLPLKFQIQFSEKEKKKMRIQPNLPEDEYMIYKLKNGDAFVYDTLHKKDLDDLKKDFIGKLLENGKLPSTISYNDALTIFINAMRACEFSSLGLSAVSVELMLSEMYRSKRNMREPFRKIYNGHNDFDYKMVRITKIPELNSTFTSLIGEDINNQLIASVLRKREGVKERELPVEKIIKY